MHDGLIFLLISPSGSGKTSIIETVLRDFQDIKRFVTYTTRNPRSGERYGIDYFFVSPNQFSLMTKTGKLVEWQKFYGQEYGSSKDELESFIKGKIDGIAAYDVLGASKLKKLYPKNIVTIFVIPPPIDSIKARLTLRYGNESEGQLRIQRFNMEMTYAGKFKYAVKNDSLEFAVEDVESIIRAERCYRRARFIQNDSKAGVS